MKLQREVLGAERFALEYEQLDPLEKHAMDYFRRAERIIWVLKDSEIVSTDLDNVSLPEIVGVATLLQRIDEADDRVSAA